MRNLPCLLILMLGAVGSPTVEAQQPTPAQVRRLLEQTLQRGPAFVPGQVIVRMRTLGPFPADRLRSLGVEVMTRPMRPREYMYQFPRPMMARLSVAQARQRLLVLLRAPPCQLPDGHQQISVTLSAGLATMPEDADTQQGLFDAADKALYTAKRTGRNRLVTANGKAAPVK